MLYNLWATMGLNVAANAICIYSMLSILLTTDRFGRLGFGP